MELLFVIDPLDTLKAYKDSSVAMMRAAQARGHAVHVCEPAGLGWRDVEVAAATQRVTLADQDEDWYRAHAPARRALASIYAL